VSDPTIKVERLVAETNWTKWKWQMNMHFKQYYMMSITMVNKDFVPQGKMSVSDVLLDNKFKYVSRISLSPTSFVLHQTM
jgi:hypothetical protein